jgi:hypothetical protein
MPMSVEIITTNAMYTPAFLGPMTLAITIMLGRLRDGPARRSASAGPGAVTPEL